MVKHEVGVISTSRCCVGCILFIGGDVAVIDDEGTWARWHMRLCRNQGGGRGIIDGRINSRINNGSMRGRYRYFRARTFDRVTSNDFCNILEAMSMRIN